MRLSILVASGMAMQVVKHPACTGEACVFPVDGAEFLTGAKFDILVEMHNVDSEFQVSVVRKGTLEEVLVDKFFGIEGEAERRWEFSYGWDLKEQIRMYWGKEAKQHHVKVVSRVWRGAEFKEAGNYLATVRYGGRKYTVEWMVRPASCQPKAKNVILFIADGTTINMLTAARALVKPHRNGKYTKKLQLDDMERIGHVLTNSLDSIFTESSNSASAYNSGHKAPVSAIGVYPDSNTNHTDDPKVELLAELARRRSPEKGGRMAIGIVTTSDVTDATPAAVYAHHRYAYYPETFLDQFLSNVSADVLLGGGGKKFKKSLEKSLKKKTKRKCQPRNHYYSQFKENGYQVVHNRDQLNKYCGDAPLLGIFHSGNMDTYVDREMLPGNLKGNQASPVNDNRDAINQPTLVEMTKASLKLLKKRGGDGGFFAMIEGASPDKQMHNMDYHRSLVEILEFDQAVKAAVDWARVNGNDTLIIVTADHGQGFDVYGTVDTTLFDAAQTNSDRLESIATYWNPGRPDYQDLDGDGFPDRLDVRTVLAAATNNHPSVYEDFKFPSSRPRKDYDEVYHSILPNVTKSKFKPNSGILRSPNLPQHISQAVHTITDVPIFASGPGAHLFGKVMDNTEVFFNIASVLALGHSNSCPSNKGCLPLKGSYKLD